MNVGQLIKALSKFNPRAKVLIAAENTGYHEVGSTKRVQVILRGQEDTGWDGPHVDADHKHLLPADHGKSVRMAVWLHPDYNVVGDEDSEERRIPVVVLDGQ